MSRKNKENIKILNVDTGFKGTLLEKFLHYTKGANNVSDIIDALSVLNSEYLVKCSLYPTIEDMPEDFKKEVTEFAAYFYENLGESTERARYANWGENDAFLLRLAESIAEYEEDNEAKEIYANMSKGQKNEVNSFTEEIFSTRKDRLLSFTWGFEGSCQLKIARTIPRQFLNELKAEIRKYVIFIIQNKGALVVREYTKGFKVKEYEIYGYRINPFGVWDAISAEEMETLHRTAPTGEKLPLENGITYTSRPRIRS